MWSTVTGAGNGSNLSITIEMRANCQITTGQCHLGLFYSYHIMAANWLHSFFTFFLSVAMIVEPSFLLVKSNGFKINALCVGFGG